MNRIAGNVIAGRVGIGDAGSSFNDVVGNYIGVDATGANAIGDFTGVSIAQPFNRLGGLSLDERNVINGVVTVSADASDVVVIGNLIGTDAGGRRAVGAGGIELDASRNFVGGMTGAEGNVIGAGPGLQVRPGADNNVIANNAVGTDITRQAVFGTGGISLSLVTGNVIVGNVTSAALVLEDGDANVLRGNRARLGIRLTGGTGNIGP